MTPRAFDFWFNWTLDIVGALWLGLAIGGVGWLGPAVGFMIGRWISVQMVRWLYRKKHNHLTRMVEELLHGR